MKTAPLFPAAFLLFPLFLLVGPHPSRGEIPPTVDRTWPPDGAVGVPLNTGIWLYGPSLRYAPLDRVRITLRAGGSAEEIAADPVLYPAADYSMVPMDRNTSGRWVGPSGNRYLIAGTPRRLLDPETSYQVRYEYFGKTETFSFTTGRAEETDPPGPVEILSAVWKKAGKNTEGRKNRYTELRLAHRDDSPVIPYLVAVYTGNPAVAAADITGAAAAPVPYAEPRTFVVYDGVSGSRAVLWGHPEEELFIRPVDLCGNRGPFSPAVRARRRFLGR
ncbi:MAG: Ig-like domain-containing protein [Spirochaetota bacterium]